MIRLRRSLIAIALGAAAGACVVATVAAVNPSTNSASWSFCTFYGQSSFSGAGDNAISSTQHWGDTDCYGMQADVHAYFWNDAIQDYLYNEGIITMSASSAGVLIHPPGTYPYPQSNWIHGYHKVWGDFDSSPTITTFAS